jgi:hypothetical protein
MDYICNTCELGPCLFQTAGFTPKNHRCDKTFDMDQTHKQKWIKRKYWDPDNEIRKFRPF